MVKFLVTPPIPSISEDCYASDALKILLKKNGVREYAEDIQTRAIPVEGAPNILEQDDEFLYSSLRSMFIDLEKRGLLIATLYRSSTEDGSKTI